MPRHFALRCALAVVFAACTQSPQSPQSGRPAGSGAGAGAQAAALGSDAARLKLAGLLPRADLASADPASRGVPAQFAAGAAGRLAATFPAQAPAPRRPARVELPLRGDGEVLLSNEAADVSIAFSLEGARPAELAAHGGAALFEAATADGFDVVLRPHAEGLEDFVFLDRAPARAALAYRVDVRRVAGLRLVANVLEFLDRSGTPALRMAPPSIVSASGERREATTRLSGCSFDTDPRLPQGRAVMPPGAPSCRVEVAWPDVTYPAVLDPAWGTATTMARARRAHIAVPIPSSTKILVAGGNGGSGAMAYAEVFDGTAWTATGSMAAPREKFAAESTNVGRILVSGGLNAAGAAQASSEVYNPADGTWIARGDMTTARYFHTLHRASNNLIYAVGGNSGAGTLKTVESFDGGTFKWSAAASMVRLREQHASVYAGGKIWVFGGFNGTAAHASAEVYDPGGNSWVELATNMGFGAYSHTATLLGGGTTVLLAGGYSGSAANANAALFNSSNSTFTTLPSMAGARWAHTATLLGNGNVLIAGGFSGSANLATAEVFWAATNTWASVSPMATNRSAAAAAPLAGGALVTGGTNSAPTNAAQVFTPIPNGSACTLAADCSTGLCVDGLCCNAACASACDVCNKQGAQGTCSAAAAGSPGSPGCGAFVCNGSAATCPSTCSADTGCASGYYCAGTACTAKKANGASCSAANQCSSNLCVDGTCCNAACASSCDACNGSVLGTCKPVAAGNAGSPGCGAYVCNGSASTCPSTCSADSGCASGYYCAGTSCTAKKANGTSCTAANQCTSGNCVDGYCCNTACSASCDVCNKSGALGSCSPALDGATGASPACTGYLCNGTATSCPTSCASDADCSSGYYCTGNPGTCAAKKANGQSCTGTGSQCTSGNCVDGYCCNTACSSSCDVCNKSGAAGTCSPAADGAASASPACTGYLCNGTATTCPTSCASDADCTSTYFCSGSACAAKKANGTSCTAANQCTSGNCADGYCCNTACSASCDVCNKSGAAGTCSPAADGAASASPACTGYLCNGTATSCPSSCTSDADCTSGYFCTGNPGTCAAKKANGLTCSAGKECTSTYCVDSTCCNTACSASCDVCNKSGAAGTCSPALDGAASASPACTGYLCNGSATGCPTACTSDADCTSGYYCTGNPGTCAAKKANGQSCTGSQCTSGNCVDGYCCNTACSAACDVCNKSGAAGTCSPAPAGTAGTCGTKVCDGAATACPSACASDLNCTSDTYCAPGGTCLSRKGPAAVCNAAAGSDCLVAGCRVCQSGYCVDGRCCDKACAEACDVCNKAGAEGTCSFAANTVACGSTYCSGSSATCPTTCATDAECVGGYCGSDARCHARRANGESCNTAAGGDCKVAGCQECQSGACVGTAPSALCCESSCTDPCGSCTGLVPGKCLPVAGGTAVAGCGAYRCSGTATACPTSCDEALGDVQCASGNRCVGGVCVPKAPLGTACSDGGDCSSNFCSDSVCCEAACDGACDACDAAGHCAKSAAGSPGSPACGAAVCDGASAACPGACTSDSGCAAGSYCATGGACLPRRDLGQACNLAADCAGGAACRECASGHCVDGVCCDAACDGACDKCDLPTPGTCARTTGGLTCLPFVCTGASSQCPTTCTDDAACAAGSYCAGGTCATLAGSGALCNDSAECLSGKCVDGRCCNSACSGACDRCDLEGLEGTCSLTGGPGDPVCVPYLCGGASAACPTACSKDADCAAGHFCDGSACQPKKALGQACPGGALQCGSGHCADGVCCDSDCLGACDACDATGSCRPLPAGSPGSPACGRAVCDGLDAACPTTCLGDNGCAAGSYCAQGGACVAQRAQGAACNLAADCAAGDCRECATGFCADGVCCGEACGGECDRCDGAAPGTCALVSNACGAYQCTGTSAACPTTCAGDAACAPGFWCQAGACAPKGAQGSPCAADAQCGTGHCADALCCEAACNGPCERCDGAEPGRCAFVTGAGEPACTPYACDGTSGACPATCAHDDECAEGHFCGLAGCEAQRELGAACDGPLECRTGRCVDGVCCDTACEGDCDACGAEGRCLPVVAGAASCKGFLCDGTSAACPVRCDSDAQCAATHYCSKAGYVCVPRLAAGAACDPVADCVDVGCRQCSAGQCAKGHCCATACEEPCATCDNSQGACQPASAGTASSACGAFLCAGDSTACPTFCSSDAQCASGAWCSDGQCVVGTRPTVAPHADDLYSCGCGPGGSAGWPVALLSLVALLGTRRRRKAATLAVALAAALAPASARAEGASSEPPASASASAVAPAAPAAGAPAKSAGALKVGVLVIQPGPGVELKTCEFLTDTLVGVLQDRPNLKTMSMREIAGMLQFERQRQLLGCSDDSCLAEIGGALGVDRLVSGSLGRLGESTVLNVQVFNLRKATVENRHTVQVSAGEEALLDAASEAVEALFPCPDCPKRVSSRQPHFLVRLRGQFQPADYLSGGGSLSVGYKFNDVVSLEVGGLLAGKNPGALLRVAVVPFFASKAVHPVVGVEGLAVFGSTVAYGAGASVGAEWRAVPWLVLGLEVPVYYYFGVPQGSRQFYFMLGGYVGAQF